MNCTKAEDDPSIAVIRKATYFEYNRDCRLGPNKASGLKLNPISPPNNSRGNQLS